METLSTKVTQNFVERGIISQSEKSIYEFGIRQGIILFINLVTILIIGLIAGELLNLAVFTGAYLFLRPYAGGYHAETEPGCYIFGVLMTIIVVFITKMIPLSMTITIVALSVSVGILMLLVPVEDYRKPLDELEVKVYREKFKWRLLLEVIITMVAVCFFTDISSMMTVAISAVAFVVLLGWVKNAR